MWIVRLCGVSRAYVCEQVSHVYVCKVRCMPVARRYIYISVETSGVSESVGEKSTERHDPKNETKIDAPDGAAPHTRIYPARTRTPRSPSPHMDSGPLKLTNRSGGGDITESKLTCRVVHTLQSA